MTTILNKVLINEDLISLYINYMLKKGLKLLRCIYYIINKIFYSRFD